MHERIGHQCALPGSIKDEQSFILKARTHCKLSEDGMYVEKIHPYDVSHWIPPAPSWVSENKQFRNIADCNGDKGAPPVLGPSMMPTNLMLQTNVI